MNIHYVEASAADRDFVAAILRDTPFRAAYSSPVTVEQMRQATALFAATPAGRKIAPGVSVAVTALAGLRCETYEPANRAASAARKVLVYLFGGGFVRGSLDMARANATRLAHAAGVPVVSVEYRQAPEHPFPAASEDLLAVYRALLDRGHAAADIVVVGESAGGTLALTLPAWLMREGIEQPAGVAGISPMTDLAMSTASWYYNAARDIATPAMGRRMVELYIAAERLGDDLVAPINSAVAPGLPILLAVGCHDSMLSDVERYALRADAAGAAVSLNLYEAMPHGFTKFDIPLAGRAIDEVAAWALACLAV